VFVPDTNTVIHYFQGKGQVAERLLATPPREVALPSVVVYELEVGVHKSPDADKRREAFDGFVQHVTVLPFARKEASAAARIRTALEAEGMLIGSLDVLNALAHGATLVTRNVRKFVRIGGLALENWYD
jgi:tRNA(fMet)-specific endonuclease VapC